MKRCYLCGCTDVSACLHKDGSPCCWVDDNLCSLCADYFEAPVLREIGEERRRRDLGCGGSGVDDLNTKDDWQLLLRNLLEEARVASDGGHGDSYRICLIQLGTVACAALDAYDRQVEGGQA